jgi:hypothetical protein
MSSLVAVTPDVSYAYMAHFGVELSTTLVFLFDGAGHQSALKVSTTAVQVAGTLSVTGTLTADGTIKANAVKIYVAATGRFHGLIPAVDPDTGVITLEMDQTGVA